MTKLWENPNPSIAFASQDITLTSNDYDFLLLISNLYLTDSTSISVIGAKGHGLYSEVEWFTQSAVHMRQRALTRVSDTQFTFGEGLIDGVTDNASLIPVTIYGIKKTITVDVSGVISDVSTDASKCIMPDGVTSASTAITNLYQYGLNYRDVTNDCDAAVTPGFYAINTDAANVPSSEFIYGVLITFGGFSVYQFAISNTNKIAVRANIGTTWRII